MKNIILFTLSLVLISIVSCDAGKREYARWKMINGSKYSIVIKAFQEGQISKTIILEKEGSIWQSENYFVGAPSGHLEPVYSALEADSLTITFDNEKIVKLNFSQKERNPLDEENYEVIRENDTQLLFTYTFTNEDYESAEEIVD